MTLAERIRLLRKRQGLTQEELAERVDVHVNTMVRWENGTRIPNAEKIQALTTALETTPAFLIGNGENIAEKLAPESDESGPVAPKLTYWADVVEKAREAAQRNKAEELRDVRGMLERALEPVEKACLALGIDAPQSSPVVVGTMSPHKGHGNAV